MASGWFSLVHVLNIIQPSTHMKTVKYCIIKKMPSSHRHTAEQVTETATIHNAYGELKLKKKKKGYVLGCSEGTFRSFTDQMAAPD